MRICHIWDSEYPWDVRAEKVSRSLTDAGHEVHMVARNRDGRSVQERLEECTVHRLRPLPLVGRKLNAASMFPAFFNPRWIGKIASTATRTQADVILCRDIPLTPSAVWVARRLGIPVVLDMAENYPAMIRAVFDNGRHRWSDYLIRNPGAVERVERWALRNVDHILVVVEESRDRLLHLGVPPERITVVSNTPPTDRLQSAALAERSSDPMRPLELVYLGLLEAPRGIATLLEAIGLFRKGGTPVRLSLIGDGRERAAFEALARRVDPWGEAIDFLGYVPNAQALNLLRSADIGIIPHHADESWNTTIPNKLFDYMAAGIAVVGSNAPPVERIINATGCGVVFRDRDAGDLARKFEELSDATVRARCGEAGVRAVAETYNWNTDARRLVQAVEMIAGAVRKAA